jgi:hypothetical protein
MSVKYEDYRIMANRIAYWIITNKIAVKKRKEYTLKVDGKTKKKSFDEIKKTILKNRNTTNAWGRKFLEAMVKDNTDTSKFPAYVTYNNKKYTKAQYIYMAKYVTKYWADKSHTKAPSTVPTSAPVVIKKYGHATKSGCDNRGQNNSVNCGPHSCQEVIRNLTGKVIKQSTLASWAGTGSCGTDHSGIETAIAAAARKLGVTLTCKWYNFSEVGWDGINKILKSNNKDCIIHNLYRNKWGHYEVINSINGSTIKVQNSLGDSCSGGCYCGYVESRSSSEFRSYISGISQKSVLVVTRSK